MNILEFAINMEIEGEKYYLDQSSKSKNVPLQNLFTILAKDENDHANILRNKSKDLPYELNDREILTEARNLFEGIKDFTNEIKENPEQLDLYKAALEKESESINLYKKLLSESTDDKSKELFEFLIKQETSHYNTIDELITQLNNVNDWVESAEFGIRSEY